MLVNYIPRDELTSLDQIPNIDPDVLKEIWDDVRGFLTDWNGTYYERHIEASIGLFLTRDELIAHCERNSGRVVLYRAQWQCHPNPAFASMGKQLMVYMTRVPQGMASDALEGL